MKFSLASERIFFWRLKILPSTTKLFCCAWLLLSCRVLKRSTKFHCFEKYDNVKAILNIFTIFLSILYIILLFAHFLDPGKSIKIEHPYIGICDWLIAGWHHQPSVYNKLIGILDVDTSSCMHIPSTGRCWCCRSGKIIATMFLFHYNIRHKRMFILKFVDGDFVYS